MGFGFCISLLYLYMYNQMELFYWLLLTLVPILFFGVYSVY